jgi:hypothetical protein
MGLPEKRAIQDFQANVYPGIESEIKSLISNDVVVEVDWDSISFAGEHAADEYANAWTTVYFTPLIAALKAVGVDDFGKKAIADKIKHVKIVASYAHDTPSGWSVLEGDTLKLQHVPDRNLEDVAGRTVALQKTLENNL